ncbi:MAG: hypothetical protein Q8R70_04500, partial [Methanoregula sp.]|nr:hypothetical protein [Methanoregula sp.]
YLGNQNDIWAYFPQELKRGDLRAFPEEFVMSKRENEPVLGLFGRYSSRSGVSNNTMRVSPPAIF